MLRSVKEHLGDDLKVRWRYFSLEQVNQRIGPDWKLWEQPESYPSDARLAWKGAEAARRQGDEAFDRFHIALLTARHVERKDLSERQTIFDAAAEAGLDLDQFERDFDEATLEAVGRDHETGVAEYGVFGTPTLVFGPGRAAFLKMFPPPPESERLEVWREIRAIAEGRPEIREIKRPVPPGR